jgi:Tol biopolymer transport system component
MDAVAVAWSPDGRRLAVTAAPTDDEPSGRLFVVNADGQGPKEIARLDERYVHTVAWSPTGDLIAFVGMEQSSGLADLYVVNPDGSGLRSLAQGENLGLAWSPDGRRLAVALSEPSSSTVHGNPINLYTIHLDDGAIARLTDEDAWEYSPAWSPDGSAIAFVSRRDAEGGIFAVHPDGSFTPLIPTHGAPPEAFLGPDGRVIAPAEASVEVDAWGGAWPLAQGTPSPDGHRLANLVSTGQMYTEGCGGDVQDLYLRNTDGTEVTNVTNTPDIHEMEVAWSPDSRLLALTSGVPPECHHIPGRLEVMKADGSERHLLTDFAASRGQIDTPRWVAGGGALLFHVTHLGPGQGYGTPAGNPQLYIVNADGSDLRRVYEPSGADFQWLLSPGGERLAIFEPLTPNGWRMLLGNVDGTGIEEVARGDGDISQLQWLLPTWSPNGARLAFSECRGDPCQSALLVINADGSGFRTLVYPYDAFEPLAWFPDGKRLAFITHPDPCRVGEGMPPGHLEIVDAETGESRRITDRCVVRWVRGWPSQ